MQTEQGKQIKLKSNSQIKFNDFPNDIDKNINMIMDINKSQILPFHRNVIKDTSKNISMSIEKINLDTSYKKVSNSNSKINLNKSLTNPTINNKINSIPMQSKDHPKYNPINYKIPTLPNQVINNK